MLDQIHRLANGYVVTPVLLSMRTFGLLEPMSRTAIPLPTFPSLCYVNEGHLRVALNLLNSLRIVEETAGGWLLTNDDWHLIPDCFREPYQLAAESWDREHWARWLGALNQLERKLTPLMADWVDGVLLVPWLVARHDREFAVIPEGPVSEWLNRRGYTDRGQWTERGANLARNAMLNATTASYRPMLAGMDDLLFGDPKRVFGHDQFGMECHLDRSLNVRGSG